LARGEARGEVAEMNPAYTLSARKNVGELRRLEARASAELQATIRRVLPRVLREPAVAVETLRAGWPSVEEELHEILAAGHLYGFWAARGVREKTLSLYGDAAKIARARMRLTDAELKRVAEAYGNEAARVLRAASASVERAAQKAVAEIVEKQMHVSEATAYLRDRLAAAGFSDHRPYLFETLARTEIQLAYAAGREEMYAQPDVDAALWGFVYVTAGDDRVRPNHAALDGVTLPKDDLLWDSISPPNGFNCRCQKIPVFDAEETRAPEDMEIDGVMTAPRPDDGWAWSPGNAFRPLGARGVKFSAVSEDVLTLARSRRTI